VNVYDFPHLAKSKASRFDIYDMATQTRWGTPDPIKTPPNWLSVTPSYHL
jgi:hypothetical protein